MQAINNSRLLTDMEVDFLLGKARAFMESRLSYQEVYSKKVTFVDEGGSYTDGTSVVISTEHFSQLLAEGVAQQGDMMLFLEGVLLHEAAHIMFTEFYSRAEYGRTISKLDQAFVDKIADWVEDGKPDDVYQEIIAIWKEINFAPLKLAINNILEDGYIERRSKLVNLRTSVVLSHMRDLQQKAHLQQVRNQIAETPIKDMEPNQKFNGIINDLLIQGTMATNDLNDTPFLFKEGYDYFLKDHMTKEEVFDIAVLCQYTRYDTRDSGQVWAATLVISDILSEVYWEEIIKPDFDEFLNQKAHDYESLKEMLDQKLEDLMDDMPDMPSMPGKSYMPPEISISDSSGASDESEVLIPKNLQDKLQAKAQEENEKNQEGSSNQSSEGQESEDGEGQEDSQQSKDGEGQEDGKQGESGKDSEAGEEGEGDAEEGEGDHKGAHADNEADSDSDSNSDSEGSSVSSEEAFGENSENAQAQENNKLTSTSEDVKSLKRSDQKAWEDELKSSEEKRMTQDINRMKNAGSGSGRAPEFEKSENGITEMNKGVRTDFIELKGTYKLNGNEREQAKRMRIQGKKMAQPLKRALTKRNRTQNAFGLRSGDLDPGNVYRQKTDNRVFEKTYYPDKQDTIIGILVDMSGSMYGQKMRDAINATYMLTTALQSLKIKFQVWGHTTGRGVEIHEYVPFNFSNRGESVLDNIYAMEANGANHDSIPIYKLLKDLSSKKRGNTNAMLWVISDGAPAGHNGYYGTPAMEDITKIINLFEKKQKVNTIGIGIGRDVRHIPNIYKHNAIVENTEDLPRELIKILESRVLK